MFFLSYAEPLGISYYYSVHPGSAKFSENLSLPLIFKNAVEIFTEYYNTCRIPLIFFFVLLGIALYYKLDKKEILIALAFFFISVIASGMLVIASYLPERSLANGIVFLIIGIVQLLQLLRSNTPLGMRLPLCLHLPDCWKSDELLGRFL